jgi:CheY-like chemotaxis protein
MPSSGGQPRPTRVLVVDDSEVFLKAVCDLLGTMADFDLVGKSRTGEEAVTISMRVHPDLILLDVILPGIDGLETCRRLRSRHPTPLVILCSVEDDPRDQNLDLPCSGAPFLRKNGITARALRKLWHEHAADVAATEQAAESPADPIARDGLVRDAQFWVRTLPTFEGHLEVHMSIGPIELLVIKFPGNKFSGKIIPELRALVESGTIRVVDILMAVTDEQGNIAVVELDELDPDMRGEFDPVVNDMTELLTHDDARALAKRIGPNSSAAVMLFENTWATKFRDAVLDADGELVLSERIPKAVVDQMVSSAA